MTIDKSPDMLSAIAGLHRDIQEAAGILLKIKSNDSAGGKSRSVFLYSLNGLSPEEEFIIDLELDLINFTAVLYHITLPRHMRNKGLGRQMVARAEEFMAAAGIKQVTLPAEHHSAGFWLKLGYRFRFSVEKQFYRMNSRRDNLYLAYEMEKDVGC